MQMSVVDRARGSLLGLAIGDALGMPTQYLTREVIRARYGLLDRFHPGPEDNELSAGVPAGRVTDDTDQAVILGRAFVSGAGRVDVRALADDLLAWEERMRSTGSLDLLGPSTKRALAAVADGADPEHSGRWGDTNGAAMRVAPIGIGCPAMPPQRLAEAVYQAGYLTHNTNIATAGAAAVAAAVSAAIDGASLPQALSAGVQAAEIGASFGHYVAGADVALRIIWAMEVVAGQDVDDALDLVYDLVGSGVSTQEAVPAAFAIASIAGHDPYFACRAAASLGGDCDTVAAMTGAICGAQGGASAFPVEVVEELHRANPTLGLEDLADQLLDVRAGWTSDEGVTQ